MEELLNPEKLLIDYRNKKISKEEVEVSIISLIENSDDIFTAMQAIKIIGELLLDGEKIFKILENCVISGFFKVSEAAANVLINHFPRKSIEPILWAISHDKFSPTYFAQLCDDYIFSNELFHHELRNHLLSILDNSIQKYTKVGVNPKESVLLAILERQYFNYTNDPGENYKTLRLIKFERIQSQKFNQFRVNENSHVIELNFGRPDNLDIRLMLKHLFHFQKLEKLTFRYCRIKKVPETIRLIKSLTFLDLSNNMLKKLPISIGLLKNLTYLNVKQNDLKMLPEQIYNLKNLETLESDIVLLN